MYLTSWFAVGFVLACVALNVIRRWTARRERATARERSSLAVTALAAAMLLYAPRSVANVAASTLAPEKVITRDAKDFVFFAKMFGLAIVFMLLLWFAAASDSASLADWMLWI